MYSLTCHWKLLQLVRYRFMSLQICRAASCPTKGEQSLVSFLQLLWPSLSIPFVQSIHLLPCSLQVGIYWASWLVSRISLDNYPFALFSVLSQQRNDYMAGYHRYFFDDGYKLSRKVKRRICTCIDILGAICNEQQTNMNSYFYTKQIKVLLWI